MRDLKIERKNKNIYLLCFSSLKYVVIAKHKWNHSLKNFRFVSWCIKNVYDIAYCGIQLIYILPILARKISPFHWRLIAYVLLINKFFCNFDFSCLSLQCKGNVTTKLHFIWNIATVKTIFLYYFSFIAMSNEKLIYLYYFSFIANTWMKNWHFCIISLSV